MAFFKDEPTWQKDIIRDIAKEKGLDPGVVREIAYYPLVFLKRIIADEEDTRSVRIRKLGIFRPKYSRLKKKDFNDKVDFIIANADEYWHKFYYKKDHSFTSKEQYIKYFEYLRSRNSYTKVLLYYNLIRNYSK